MNFTMALSSFQAGRVIPLLTLIRFLWIGLESNWTEHHHQTSRKLDVMTGEWYQKFCSAVPPVEDPVHIWKPKNPACIELYEKYQASKLSELGDQNQSQPEEEDPGESF